MSLSREIERANTNGMGKDREGHIVQAVPLVEGRCNLGPGEHFTRGVIHCVEDGTIKILWPSGGTPTDIVAVAGEDFAYYGKCQILGGMFHLC